MDTKASELRSKRVVVLQHAQSETLGTIEAALCNVGVGFDFVRTFAGEGVPLSSDGYAGLVVMGGPMGVYETNRYPFLMHEMRLIERFVARGLPVLGVCLGSQLLAAALGAKVQKGARKEIGWYPVELSQQAAQDPVWRNQPVAFWAFHWHGDVFSLPASAVPLAASGITPLQAYRVAHHVYGVLFHLEVSEDHIRAMLNEFGTEISDEGLSCEEILGQSRRHLPALQTIGATVFRRWAEKI